MRRGTLLCILCVAGLSVEAPAARDAFDQAAAGSPALRTRVERRFDVLPLQNGLVLRPKFKGVPVRSIEISNGTVAIDGHPATGSELRERLGSDADMVLELSYLDPGVRRVLFGFEEHPPEGPGELATPAEKPAEAPPSPPERPRRRSGAQVRIMGNVTVAPDEIVEDDVVVIGGSAHVDGQVNGQVVVVGGAAELGPSAEIHGDVTVIGGTLSRDPAAHVRGKVNEIAGSIDLRGWRPRHRGSPSEWFAVRPFAALIGTLLRWCLVTILACAAWGLARQPVERIAERVATEPLRSGLIGLLVELLFLPALIVTAVVLAISIIGIPLLLLLPFAIVLLLVVSVGGFSAVAYHVGRRAAARWGWHNDSPYRATALGTALILSPVLLARLVGLGGWIVTPLTTVLVAIGIVVEYIAWTVGLGAVALVRFAHRFPPPAPAEPSVSSIATPATPPPGTA
jgi:hypothetical protein